MNRGRRERETGRERDEEANTIFYLNTASLSVRVEVDDPKYNSVSLPFAHSFLLVMPLAVSHSPLPLLCYLSAEEMP